MLFLDKLPQSAHAAFEFFAGFGDLFGVVNDAGSHEDDEFGAFLTKGFAAEAPAEDGDAMKDGDTGRGLGIGFVDDATDGDGVAVFEGDLGVDGSFGEGRRVDGSGGGGLGGADFLVNDEGDDAAGVHAGGDGKGDATAAVGDVVGEQGTAATLDSGSGRGCKGRHLGTYVDAGGDGIGSDDAGGGDDAGSIFILGGGEEGEEFSALADEGSSGEVDRGVGERAEKISGAALFGAAAGDLTFLEEGGDAVGEGAGKGDFINFCLDENLARSDIDFAEDL